MRSTLILQGDSLHVCVRWFCQKIAAFLNCQHLGTLVKKVEDEFSVAVKRWKFDQKVCQTFVQFHVIWGFGNKLPNFPKPQKKGKRFVHPNGFANILTLQIWWCHGYHLLSE